MRGTRRGLKRVVRQDGVDGKTMKKASAQTLSAHLTEEATKFFLYPHRIYRSRANLYAQQSLDDFGRRLVEWRKTFAPHTPEPVIAEFYEPVFLDQLYCRTT